MESVELTFMNDEYMNLTWALAKATSFFNQVTAKVTTSDGLTSIYDATTEVAEQVSYTGLPLFPKFRYSRKTRIQTSEFEI